MSEPRLDEASYRLVAWIGYGAMLAYGVRILTRLVRKNRPLVFTPSVVAVASLLVYFPFLAIDKLATGRYYRFIEPQDFILAKTCFLGLTALLAFEAGYSGVVPRALGRLRLRSPSGWSGRREATRGSRLGPLLGEFLGRPLTLWIPLALVPVGLLGHLQVMPGGAGGTFVLQSFLKWAVFLLFLNALYRRTPGSWTALAALSIVYFGFQLAKLSSNRAETLVPLCGLLGIWDNFRSLRTTALYRNTARRAAILAFAALAFVVLSQLRFQGEAARLSLVEGYRYLVFFFDFGLETAMKVVCDMPSRVAFLHGDSFYYTIAQFIPSALWQGKPLGGLSADFILTPLLYPQFRLRNVLPPPLPAELYANGGIWLVIIGMAIGGLAIRKIEDELILRGGDGGGFLSGATAALWVHLVRGPISNFILRLTTDVVPIVVIIGLAHVALKSTSGARVAAKDPRCWRRAP